MATEHLQRSACDWVLGNLGEKGRRETAPVVSSETLPEGAAPPGPGGTGNPDETGTTCWKDFFLSVGNI